MGGGGGGGGANTVQQPEWWWVIKASLYTGTYIATSISTSKVHIWKSCERHMMCMLDTCDFQHMIHM